MFPIFSCFRSSLGVTKNWLNVSGMKSLYDHRHIKETDVEFALRHNWATLTHCAHCILLGFSQCHNIQSGSVTEYQFNWKRPLENQKGHSKPWLSGWLGGWVTRISTKSFWPISHVVNCREDICSYFIKKNGVSLSWDVGTYGASGGARKIDFAGAVKWVWLATWSAWRRMAPASSSRESAWRIKISRLSCKPAKMRRMQFTSWNVPLEVKITKLLPDRQQCTWTKISICTRPKCSFKLNVLDYKELYKVVDNE